MESNTWKQCQQRWLGYEASVPTDWRLEADGERWWAFPSEANGAAALFWVWIASPTHTIEDHLRTVLHTAATGATSFRAWNHSKNEPTKRSVVFARGDGNNEVRGALEIEVLSQRLVLVRGYQLPLRASAALRATVERITSSFRCNEPIRRSRYIDRTEGAWSILVPEGWNCTGGVDRSKGQTTIVWTIEDPQSHARAQQPGITIDMIVPGAWGGLTQSLDPNGWKYQPFLSAEQFCRSVLLQLAKQSRPDLTLEAVASSAEVEGIARAGLRLVEQKMGVQAMVSGAFAFSHYTEGNFVFRECTIVSTFMLPNRVDPMAMMLGGAAQYWFATVGPTMRAPIDAFETHFPVLQGIVRSFRGNEQWEQREVQTIHTQMEQERVAAEHYRAELMKETQAYLQARDREIIEHRQATQAEIQRGQYNLITGKEDVRAEDGQAYKVDAGYQSYWKKNDTILAANSAELDSTLEQNGWSKMQVY